jgi:proton-coupled amino acid transporter
MAHPEQWPYAVAGAFSCCAVFNAGFGVAGAIAWGSEVQPIVILNLPGGVISNMVKICLCVDLFLTFPIVIYPSIDLLESQEAIKALMPPSGTKEEYWSKNLLR